MRIDVVADVASLNAECPVWNPVDELLYWADIPKGHLYAFDPRTGSYNRLFEAGEQIGAIVVAEDGSLVLGLEEGRVVRWRKGDTQTICAGLDSERGRRYNDGIVDPVGRILLGTMPGGRDATIYAFEGSRHWVLMDGLGQANGNDFSLDGQVLYVTDTKARTLSAYRYDVDAGRLGESTLLAAIQEDDGVPDGLEVDSEGSIWSARWGGGCVVRYAPDGQEIDRIELPTSKVSSLAFGGPRLDKLYITTAGGDDRAANGAHAGAVFVAEVEARGRPAYLARR